MTIYRGDDQPDEPASQELLNLIWDLSQGVINDADQIRLDSLLLESPENRATYTQFMQLIALLEHDQSAPIELGDASSNVVADSSIVHPDLSHRMKCPSPLFPDHRRRFDNSFAAVFCVSICLLLTVASMFLFVPTHDHTVARSEPDSVWKFGQNRFPAANGDQLVPENSPLFQKQLDELAQLNSGGP